MHVFLQGIGEHEKNHYHLISIIHYTHHLQPGIRGEDLVLFILAQYKANKEIGYLII